MKGLKDFWEVGITEDIAKSRGRRSLNGRKWRIYKRTKTEIDKQKSQIYSEEASLGVVAWLPERKPLEPDPDNAGAGKRCLQLHFHKCLRSASPIFRISPHRSVIQ